MALTVEITKASVNQETEDDFTASIHVVVKDEAEAIIFDKTYSERYFSQLDLDVIKQKLQDQFTADWNKHVAEQDILNAAQFDALVAELETDANIYINS